MDTDKFLDEVLKNPEEKPKKKEIHLEDFKTPEEIASPTVKPLFGIELNGGFFQAQSEIPLDLIDGFPSHPYKVKDDESMKELIESVKSNGIINPIIVRKKENGRFELISGHRRKMACELAGIAKIPAVVKEMDLDKATIFMVDSNLQRENILPSEKAFSYKMKLEALKKQGKRKDLTSPQVGAKLRTDELIGSENGDSKNQVQRYIRLTNLIPKLLEMVDERKIAFTPAVELSYLNKTEQKQLLNAMELNDNCTPSHVQAIRLKKLSADGKLNEDTINEIIKEEKPNQKEQFKFIKDDIRHYFPSSFTDKQILDTMMTLLEQYQKRREHNRDAR